MNRTLQDRLVNEYRLAGVTTLAAADRYLRDRFLPPSTPSSAGRRPIPAPPSCPWAPSMKQYLCVEEERVVGRGTTS